MKVRAVIQARMSSTRLRGKSLIAVAGRPLLLRVLERVARMPFVTETVVATTAEVADRPIAALVREMGFRCVVGDSDDVLSRFVDATSDLDNDDVVVRFTADNPLYDSDRSATAFAAHVEGSWDYTHIDGLSHVVPEFLQVEALRKVNIEADDHFDKEHVTHFFRRQNHAFRVQTLPADFAGLRPEFDRWLTIDQQADLDRLERMLVHLEVRNEQLPLEDCYQWLDQADVGGAAAPVGGKQITILEREVGDGQPCFIIAEIGQNHNGQVEIAKRLIETAARCGCDAVKFQKRDVEWELTREARDRPYDNPNSFGPTYGEHRVFLELNEQQHLELRDCAEANGLVYFCTACDPPSVELMERVGNPCYKIASRDIENIPLLKRVTQTGKPVILSTGMAGAAEIAAALDALNGGSSGVILTHCVSQYPTELHHVNLRALETMRLAFHVLVGLSDHTTGIVTSIAAAVLGACCIEKHITLSRAMQGTDHAAALEEEGLRRLVKYIREVELARGSGKIEIPNVVETAKRKLSRSLISRCEIPTGTCLTEDMLVLKSPGTGLGWHQRSRIVGKVAKQDIASDILLNESLFE